MTMFRFRHLRAENFRCFETLELPLEDDLTVLFAENGGGKSALLAALAMGMAVFQRGSPKEAKLGAQRDPRLVAIDERGRREPAGPCRLTWTAEAGESGEVGWSTAVNPASGRTQNRHREILEAMEGTRRPGERWPLFAWYGTDRLGRGRVRRRPAGATRDRWEGYASSLDPALSDGPLLQWFTEEILSDAVRRREDEPERFLDAAVADAMIRATPGVVKVWYEPREESPSVRFENGSLAVWSELSDGYHGFLALVADIARRAVMLNEIDGGDAPERAEGVVLVDEIDLHLHPRWQRVVLDGLREAFPRLQFVVTTHSPQVLSSAQNRQARRLVDWRIQEHGVFVEGRDSNAILRELMATDDRDEVGKDALRELHNAIDQGRQDDAEQLYAALRDRWGDLDPALIRARALMDWAE